MSDLQVSRVGTLSAPEGFAELVSLGVGPAGPVASWSTSAGRDALFGRHLDAGGASFADAVPADPPAVAIATYRGDEAEPAATIVVGALPIGLPHIQPLPGGGYIVVGTRCRWSPEGPDQNALLIGPDGKIRHRGCLGDGISHLETDAEGTVWATYFDEGVFGNFGWGGADGPTPLGSPGIVRWSAEFEQLWAYPQEDPFIDACYTLNAAHGGAWVATSATLSILHLTGDDVRIHPTENISRPRGVLTDGERLGIVTTHSDSTAVVVGGLNGDRFAETYRSRLVTPDGTPLPRIALHCRDSIAHFFADREWYRFDLTECP